MLAGSLWRHFLTHLQFPMDSSSELTSSILFLGGKNVLVARVVNGMNYNPEIMVYPLQEPFKVPYVHITVIARSEIQTIQTI